MEQGGLCRLKEHDGNGDDKDDQDEQHKESIDGGESTSEEESEEAWEGISDEKTVSAKDNTDAEGDNPDSQPAPSTRASGSEPRLTTARDSAQEKQTSPSDSKRLGVLTAFKFDVELGLVGLHGRRNRQR